MLRICSRDAHQTAQGLNDHVISGLLAVRAGSSESRNGGADQTRIELLEPLWRKPESVHRSWSKVLDEHVSSFDEAREDFGIPRLIEIECHAPLSSIDTGEISAQSAWQKRTETAGIVPTSGPFDFDHIGPEVREDHRAKRPGEDAGLVEHAHASQRGVWLVLVWHLSRFVGHRVSFFLS